MSVENGYKKYKKYIKQSDDTYKLTSHWTSSNTVEMDDGKTLETNLGAITGLTSSLASTSQKIALSASAGKNLQDQITSSNQKISTNASDIVALSEEIDLMDVQTTYNGECPDSKSGNLELIEIVGNTEQKTVAGNQLFDASKLLTKNVGGATVTNNGDGSFTVSGSGNLTDNCTSQYIINNPTFLKEGAITLDSGAKTYPVFGIEIKSATGVLQLTNAYDARESKNLSSELLNGANLQIIVNYYGASGQPIVSGTVKPMLYQDGDGTWEPFVGHTQSPNPDNPIALENTFDCVEMIQGYYGANAVWITATNRICSRHDIPCKSGDKIAIAIDDTNVSGNIIYFVNGTFTTSVPLSISSEIVVPSGVTSFKFNLVNSKTDITPQTIGKITLKVNGKYVGQIVEHGKNLFDYDTHVANGSRFQFSVEGGKTLYRNANIGSANNWIVYDEKGNSLGTFYTLNFTASRPLTLPTEASYIHVQDPSVTSEQYIGYDSDISFEPYQEKLTTFYLNEPLREGDSIVRKDGVFGVNRKRVTKVFNGSEKWYFNTNGNVYFTAIDNAKQNMVDSAPIVYCDQYKCHNVANVRMNNNSIKVCRTTYTEIAQLWINNTNFTSVDDIKNALQANPITVEYELAEPIFTPFDTETQIALNGLETFDGATYINADSKVKAKSISAKYCSSEVGSRVFENTKRIEKIEKSLAEEDLFDICTSNETTLEGSKKGGLKLNYIEGNSDQYKCNGYQLFDASKIPTKTQGGATVTNNGDGSFTVSGSGNLTESFSCLYLYSHEETVKLIKVGTLYLTNIEKSSSNRPYAYIQLLNKNGIIKELSGASSSNAFVEILQEYIDDESFVLKIGIYGETDAIISTNAKIKPMLYQDGDGTWEKFVGGTQSPNPDYPQAIENTFDCVEMVQGIYRSTTGAYNVSNLGICNKYSIPCKNGDLISIETETPYNHVVIFYKNDEYLSYDSKSNIAKSNFTAPSGATHFKFDLTNSYDITPQTVGKISLTVNDKYVGQIVEHGKNLLDCRGLTTYTSPSGITYTPVYKENGELEYINVNGTATANSQFLLSAGDYIPSGSYILSGCANGGSESSYYLQVQGVSENTGYGLVDIGNGDSGTFISNDVLKSVAIQIKSGTTLTNAKFYPMLRRVDTDSAYEPYKEKVTTFFLDEPLRKDDRVVRKDGVFGVERKRSTVVFDGNDDEVWNLYTNTNADGNTYGFTVWLSKLPKQSTVATDFALCDRFIQRVRANVSTKDDEGFYLGSGDFMFVKISQSVISDGTLEALKTWLQENPITVEYELAEPTFTPFDTETQIAFNSLETYDGVTYIDFDSKVKPNDIECEYGVNKIGSYTLRALNENEIDKIERAELKARLDELAVALVALH